MRRAGDKNRARAGREQPARTAGAAHQLGGKLGEPGAPVSRKNSSGVLESISPNATEIK